MGAVGDERWHRGMARMMIADAVLTAARGRSKQDAIASEMIAHASELKNQALALLAAAEADEREEVWVR